MSLQIIVIVVYLARIEALLLPVPGLLVRGHVCKLSFIRHVGVMRKISKFVVRTMTDGQREQRWDGQLREFIDGLQMPSTSGGGAGGHEHHPGRQDDKDTTRRLRH